MAVSLVSDRHNSSRDGFLRHTSLSHLHARRSQITVYIILGIILIILSLSLFIYYMISSQVSVEKAQEGAIDAAMIKDAVESCVDSSLEQGIKILGIQGGKIFMNSSRFVSSQYSDIIVSYDSGTDLLPKKEEMQIDLEMFLSKNLQDCLNLSSFREQGYSFEFSDDNQIDVMIQDSAVSVKLNYPITIIKGDARTTISEFSSTAEVRLGHVHDVLQKILISTGEDPQYIDITSLSKYDLNISVIPYNKTVLVYSLSDTNSTVEGNPFIFLSAFSFTRNQPPIFTLPPTFRLKENQLFTYKVNATDPEGDQLIYSDDTIFFDVLDDGTVMFIPEIPGEFNITITVEDSQGYTTSHSAVFVVS